MNRQSDNKLWEYVLKDIAISGDDVTQIPYFSKETFRDMKECPYGRVAGLEWKTMAYRHNYCLIVAFSLNVRVALAITGLSGCDLTACRVKISKTIDAISRQSKEINPLPYREFKALRTTLVDTG